MTTLDFLMRRANQCGRGFTYQIARAFPDRFDARFSIRIFSLLMIGWLYAALSGCAVSAPRVDPYSGLISANMKIEDFTPKPIDSSLWKRQPVYLVTGANFESYAKTWDTMNERVKSPIGALSGYSRATLDEMMDVWSPTKATSNIVIILNKYFDKVIPVSDLAAARDKKARWIVLFDHTFYQASTATATWTNTTVIDLLNSDLKRAIHSEFRASKDYGAAWGSGDVERFSKYRGIDIQDSLNGAGTDFEKKLASMSK